MYLQNIMSNYLNENTQSKFEVSNEFKPIQAKKSSWSNEEKKITKKFVFKKRKFLEAFVIEILKYIRETDAQIEVRFREKSLGIIIHALSSSISEIELDEVWPSLPLSSISWFSRNFLPIIMFSGIPIARYIIPV